jgi:DNA-binding HxlR family transcriptional regulator
MVVAQGRLYGCPVELALDQIGGKWKTIVLSRLKIEPMAYSELRRAIPGLADKVLTQRLKDLVADGFVERLPGEGGGAVYVLTAEGRSLTPVLEALYAWGREAGLRGGARFSTENDAPSVDGPRPMLDSRIAG